MIGAILITRIHSRENKVRRLREVEEKEASGNKCGDVRRHRPTEESGSFITQNVTPIRSPKYGEKTLQLNREVRGVGTENINCGGENDCRLRASYETRHKRWAVRRKEKWCRY